MITEKIKIPEISDSQLKERMEKIKFICPAMQGTDGKIHHTDEQDQNLFDLFYSISKVDPRKKAFNFDDNRKWGEKATDLEVFHKQNIYVAIGGYYGFCKVTMAEIMSQIPEEILSLVVAFSLDPEMNATILNEDYQSLPIILYKKREKELRSEDFPEFEGLIKTFSMEKAIKFKNLIRPMINYNKEGLVFIAPGDVEKPFLRIGIWLRVNGSNLHETNPETPAEGNLKFGKEILVYQEFGKAGADFFHPSYLGIISQIPEELLTKNVVGFCYGHVDYFKSTKGVLHQAKFTLIEKIS